MEIRAEAQHALTGAPRSRSGTSMRHQMRLRAPSYAFSRCSKTCADFRAASVKLSKLSDAAWLVVCIVRTAEFTALSHASRYVLVNSFGKPDIISPNLRAWLPAFSNASLT